MSFYSDLAEARDASTPSERLAALWRETLSVHHEVRVALVQNPSLPFTCLDQALRRADRYGSVAFWAWFNPSIQLFMLSYPVEVRSFASDVLVERSTRASCRHMGMNPLASLEELVESWSRVSRARVENDALFFEARETRRLAQRLAELFSLPWKETA